MQKSYVYNDVKMNDPSSPQ